MKLSFNFPRISSENSHALSPFSILNNVFFPEKSERKNFRFFPGVWLVGEQHKNLDWNRLSMVLSLEDLTHAKRRLCPCLPYFSAEPKNPRSVARQFAKAKFGTILLISFRSQARSFPTPANSPQSKAQKKQDFVHAYAAREIRRGIFNRYVRGRFKENEAGK